GDLPRRPQEVQHREVGRPVKHLDARIIRLADRAHQRGGVGDGARHDLLHGLPGPLGKRGAKIGDELVEVEHDPILPYESVAPKWLPIARRPESVSRTVRLRRSFSAQPRRKKVSAMAAPSEPEMCGRRSLQSRHWRAKWRLPARRAPGTSTPILWQNSSPVSVSFQSRGPLGSIWPALVSASVTAMPTWPARWSE